MAKANPPKILLEVERKFTRLRCYPLVLNGGFPAFQTLHNNGRKRFRDVYFDENQQLSKAGTWLRRRNGVWQSKVRQGGDYTNSRFREIMDHDEITNHIRSIVGSKSPISESFGLSQLADITTDREIWTADEKFQIVLDQTDFGHSVGEIELESWVDAGSPAEIDRQLATMDMQLTRFMDHYHWAFERGQPIGKLTAYFAQKP